jgi:hypothetical protein
MAYQSRFFAYKDVGKGREQDAEAGGRAPAVGALGDAGAVAEDAEALPTRM